MALVYDTLRTNLLVLFAWLGLMTLVVLAWSLGGAVVNHLALRGDMRNAREADALIRLSYDLRKEDAAVFAALNGQVPTLSPERAAAMTDAAFERVRENLDGHREGAHEVALTELQLLSDGLRERRAAVRSALERPALPRAPVLRRWRAFLQAASPRLEAISHDLIREAGTSASPVARMTALRHYALTVFGTLVENRFAIEALIADPAPSTVEKMRLTLASAGLSGAAHLAEDQFVAEEALAFRRIEAATVYVLDDYLKIEARLLDDLAAGRADPKRLDDWRKASSRAATEFALAETALAERTEQVLAEARRRGLAAMSLWGAAFLLAGGLLASATRFTLHRIVSPLEEIHARMLRLAQDDLSVEIGRGPRLAEIRAMHDALAVFKENGLRRARMQAELARLNDRVVWANHAMTEELEAAARVQTAQLPAPCDLPGAGFHTFYRPSRMIAGDSYDYVTLPDGRTRLFQIDVSGHGAAAALVSVMSHFAVRSALVAAAPEEPLAAIVARINAEWNEDLPYFTMLLVEIDPRARIARVVQAGHPPLLRLPGAGGVQTVGDGGMPVGALPWAEFEECLCPFLPGDRLLLTTDGVTEAADAQGALFGEDRYLDLLDRHGRADVRTLFAALEAALWDWCGTEAFDDDVTLLILEAKEALHAH